MSRGRAYDFEVFRPSVLDFGYKDVNEAIIWVVEPMTEELASWLKDKGYAKGKTYFDFYEAIYGEDIYGVNDKNADIFKKRKEGKRDIQFLE